jgi:hypothetical protein
VLSKIEGGSNVGKDLKVLMKYRNTKFSTLVNQWDKTCKKCDWPEDEGEIDPEER